MDILKYAQLGADTIMNTFLPAELPPTHRFHYHQGVFLSGVERLYKLTGDKKYYDYIKAWVDFNVDENGNIPRCYTTEFDDIQPGILLFGLYDETGDTRYKKVLDLLADAINAFPVNSLGAVWHKYRTPHQMWLDCMYMMGVITTMYAVRFNRPDMIDKVYALMRAMRDKMTNPETGLMYHMYDESRLCRFADKESGLVKVHWGRAMGWFAVAMFDIAQLLPPEDTRRCEFIEAGKALINSLLKYQDKETGLWYQVVDKPENSMNWTETSCSMMFTYAMAKAVNMGVADAEYADAAAKGWRGILTRAAIKGGRLELGGICVGTGVGIERYYYGRDTVTNDLHGMGAFLLAATEIHKSGITIQ